MVKLPNPFRSGFITINQPLISSIPSAFFAAKKRQTAVILAQIMGLIWQEEMRPRARPLLLIP